MRTLIELGMDTRVLVIIVTMHNNTKQMIIIVKYIMIL